MQTSPPAWDRPASLEWAYSDEAKKRWAAGSHARAEALNELAAPLEALENREVDIRKSVALELRGSSRRTVLVAVLVALAAVAAAVPNLL